MSNFKLAVERARQEQAERDITAFRTNTLLEKALNYLDKPTTPEELRTQDMTNIFLTEFLMMTEKREYLNINVNGLPASGKSTVGIALLLLGMNHIKKPFTLWNIARDQTEYGRRIKNDCENTDTFLLIDEWNELETTGFNSSKRQAYLETESDLLGQRNIRKIGCSPKNQVDKNAFIIIEVLQQDRNIGVTRCLLYYKLYASGQEYQQLLGHIDVDVTAAMKHIVYNEYRKRKFERMDLIVKEGVDSPERLYQARIIYDVSNELRKLARSGMVNRALIKLRLDNYAQEKKELLSIIGREDLVDSIKGILEAEKEHAKIQREIIKLTDILATKHDEIARIKLEEFHAASDIIAHEIKKMQEHNKHLMQLLDTYENIDR